jgi:hypothetical protein
MGTRIVTLQRQARELGRLRTGYTDTSGSKPRPVRSATWIVTSHAEHYVAAAAEVWGGKVEKWQPLGSGAPQWRAVTDTPSLDAILPPGDPMSQAYESWSRGGAQRRCDGMTETLADQPCFCRAQWGDNFHETAPRDAACKITTRLNVILPEMPDIGAWRVETHSFYSANEMAAAVDVLKGSIGADALIPVRLRIEQRTRVAQGKTKQFPVVAVELRGSTAGQVLAGSAQSVPVSVGGGNGPAAAVDAPTGRPAVANGQAPAIEAPAAPTAEDFLVRARAVQSFADFRVIWAEAAKAGVSPTPEQSAEMTEIGNRLKAAESSTPPAPAPETQPQAAATSDVDVLWQAIVARWPRGMTELAKTFEGAMGQPHQTATENELAAFLKIVDEGRYDAQVTAAAGGLDEKVPF